MKKIFIILAIIVLLLAGGFAAYWFFFASQDARPEEQAGQQDTGQDAFDKTLHSIDEPGSLWWVVNKNRPMPDDYEPSSLVVPDMKLRWAPVAESMHVSQQMAAPLEAMFQASRDAKFDLMLISGYRSYKTQKELYDGYVADLGQKEADQVSAKPGTSEHQTGLAVDLGRSDKECQFEECFGDTPEGKWLAEHAHEYGFIIRYTKGKEAITGYMYEPWHLRYVDKELAAELHAKRRTMEEFFGL